MAKKSPPFTKREGSARMSGATRSAYKDKMRYDKKREDKKDDKRK